MPSSQGHRGAHLTLYQRIYLTSKRSTRLKTQTLDYICPPPTHNKHRDRLQSAETTSPYSVCVAIDLTAALDTGSHDILISKIAGWSLPPAITRWLSCYLRGRLTATGFRVIKSSTGVPQGSKLSPSLFDYYIVAMPKLTPPVNMVCYADDITVWASGPKIPLLESMINSYLRDVDIYRKENSLFISAPKSTVTLSSPDKHQFQTHPDIIHEYTQLPRAQP